MGNSKYKFRDLIKFFKSLPDDYCDRDFELQITDLVKKDIDGLEKNLTCILQCNKNTKVKYSALYTLSILYRYEKKFDDMGKLLKLHEAEFKGTCTYSHLCLLHRLNSGETLTCKDIITARENSQKMENNAGIVHIFADITAKFYEELDKKRSNDMQEALEKELDNKRSNDIQEALKAVNKAMSLDDSYIKYHCTKSRLLFLEGNLDDALSEINTAIDGEVPTDSNYVINLNQYLNHKMKILKRDINNQTKTQIDKLQKEQGEINGALNKNMEFIGFFAGIVALVIGSIQIAAGQQSFSDAAKLIIVLFGSLLTVFAGFGIILHGFDKKLLPNLCIMILGLIAIGGVALFL